MLDSYPTHHFLQHLQLQQLLSHCVQLTPGTLRTTELNSAFSQKPCQREVNRIFLQPKYDYFSDLQARKNGQSYS